MQKEETYKNTIVATELEERKKQLEDIRNFYKPIEKEDFKDHLKKYQ